MVGSPNGVFVFCLTHMIVMQAQTTAIKEYCQMDLFEATCPEHHVIVMQHALYGRMRLGRCVTTDYGNLGCSVDVRDYMDFRCSGRRLCSFKVPDDTLYAMRSCLQDVTPYLEASYSCVKVDSEFSCNAGGPKLLTAPSGTLTNYHREGRCLWLIKAPLGQRVNVTLLDFGTVRQRGLVGEPMSGCQKYAVLKENRPGRDLVVCSGRERHKTVYISQGNEISVETIGSSSHQEDDNMARFLLQYHVMGCENPGLSSNMHLTREGDTASITCNTTGESLHLVCKDNKWVGHLGYCPGTGGSTDEERWSVLGALTTDWSTPSGLVIVVGLGIGLGIVIGVALLFCVLAYFKRKDRRRRDTLDGSFFSGGNDLGTLQSGKPAIAGKYIDSERCVPAYIKDNTVWREAGTGRTYYPSPGNDEMLCTCPSLSPYAPGDGPYTATSEDATQSMTSSRHVRQSDHIYETPK